MNEQARQILQMLAEGKVTADEAERLIDALERQELASPAGAEPRAKRRPKYLRVVLEDNSEEAPSHINVRVPLQLLRAGVRLTSLIPPRALTQLNAKLDESGVPVDLTQLRPQDIEELVDQLDDVTVDVDDPTSKIRVFCE
jgi:polyhydroxyalkanoate synthesis regulator phasin